MSQPLLNIFIRIHNNSSATAPPVVSISTSEISGVRVGTKIWWNSSLAAYAKTTDNASPASAQFHGRASFFTGRRTARHTSHPKIAYSVKCPVLRNKWCISPTITGDMWGNSHRNSGSNIVDEC